MLRSVRIGCLISITIVSACSTKPAPTPNEQLADKAKASVRDTLKDPTSAKFKGVRASAKLNCMYGKLLARNSYGAYTGYQDFVWIDGATTIKPDSEAVTTEAKTGGSENFDAYTSYLKAYNKCLGEMVKPGAVDLASDMPDDV